jgi:intein-encoded DNA endonuclease-like protein
MEREYYTHDILDKISVRLESYPKCNAPLRKSDAVYYLRDAILALRDKGYSWKDIVDALAKDQFHISSVTLQKYLRNVNTQSGGKRIKKQPKPKGINVRNFDNDSIETLDNPGRFSLPEPTKNI